MAVRTFPKNSTLAQVLEIVTDNCDKSVKIGLKCIFYMLSIIPTRGINLAIVEGVTVDNKKIRDGYILSITKDVESAFMPFEQVCENSLLQFFIAMDDNGRAIDIVPCGQNITFLQVEHTSYSIN